METMLMAKDSLASSGGYISNGLDFIGLVYTDEANLTTVTMDPGTPKATSVSIVTVVPDNALKEMDSFLQKMYDQCEFYDYQQQEEYVKQLVQWCPLPNNRLSGNILPILEAMSSNNWHYHKQRLIFMCLPAWSTRKYTYAKTKPLCSADMITLLHWCKVHF